MSAFTAFESASSPAQSGFVFSTASVLEAAARTERVRRAAGRWQGAERAGLAERGRKVGAAFKASGTIARFVSALVAVRQNE